jgi:cytochrome c oxidase subunit 2
MAVALRLALLFIAAACACLFLAHPVWFPAGVSAQSATIDHQFAIAFWILGGLFLAAHAVLAVSLMRSRQSGKQRNSHGDWRMEAAWTLAIAALFFGFNVAGVRLWSKMKFQQPESNAIQVEVTGVQFQWYFRYAGADGVFGHVNAQRFARPQEGNPLGLDPGDADGKDDIVSTALVLPVGRDVDLTLRSQDVIHSLFIPAMRFKQDAVPGLSIHAHFRPVKIGAYEISCAELCGIGHYRMRAVAQVVSDEEFQRWLKAREVQK